MKAFVVLIGSLSVGCGGSGDPPSAEPDSGSLCGNGRLDPGEACDGTLIDNRASCYSLTMGQSPEGYLFCQDCVPETFFCRPASQGSPCITKSMPGMPWLITCPRVSSGTKDDGCCAEDPATPNFGRCGFMSVPGGSCIIK